MRCPDVYVCSGSNQFVFWKHFGPGSPIIPYFVKYHPVIPNSFNWNSAFQRCQQRLLVSIHHPSFSNKLWNYLQQISVGHLNNSIISWSSPTKGIIKDTTRAREYVELHDQIQVCCHWPSRTNRVLRAHIDEYRASGLSRLIPLDVPERSDSCRWSNLEFAGPQPGDW